MKVGDLVKMVERYALDVEGCRTVGGEPMELGIVVDITKTGELYRIYPNVHVLWSDSIRGYSSFQVEAVYGEYVEVVE
jgi:hypothetical protein